MTRRAITLMGLAAAAVVAAGVLHRWRSTSECEGLAAAHRWEAMATVCEETFHRTGDPSAAARALYGLSALGRTADVDRRLVWLEGTRFAPAISYFSAMSAKAKGDEAAATRLLVEALESSRGVGLHEYAALAAQKLASAQWVHGQFQQAFATLDTAFKEARQCDDQLLLMHLDGQLADLLGEVGDLTGKARALSSLAKRAKDYPRTLAQVRLRQGEVEEERSNVLLARDAFQAALDGSQDAGLLPVARAAHLSLANLARREGDLDGGEAHLLAAAEIPVRFGYEGTAWAFARAKLYLARGDCGAAREVVRGALDAGALPDWQWQLLGLEGGCAEQQGDEASARRAFGKAVQVIEELQREQPTAALRFGVLASRREPYEALFELSLRSGEEEAALNVMERLLARAFLETMAKRGPDGSGELQSVRLAALASTMIAQRPLPGSVMEGLAELGDREAIGFIAARGTLYRAHVSGGRVAFARVDQLETVVKLLDRLAAHPDDPEAAEVLGERLWPERQVAARVLIVADGPLANLSFAGLRHHGRWVVEDHVLSRAPSLSAAVRVVGGPRGGTSGGGARVLGDPTGDLPAAAAEAVALAHRLGVQPLRQRQATVAELMASCHADLLHFAGHSGVGSEGGWLELADGRVTAPQLLAVRCAPRVVYLASCASGVQVSGQVTTTLADAFFAAGSQSVIATTRSVDDTMAAAFTREFFLDGAFDHPAERVAQAQRRLLKSQPRSAWAPFFVIGP